MSWISPAVSAATPATRAFGPEELLKFALDGVKKALLLPALPTPFCEFKDDDHAEEEECNRDQQIAQIDILAAFRSHSIYRLQICGVIPPVACMNLADFLPLALFGGATHSLDETGVVNCVVKAGRVVHVAPREISERFFSLTSHVWSAG
jgi:hypothetical protein